MCECTRVMKVYMKHNDLSSVSIDHVGLTIDGYMPHLGIFGGDDTSMTICLDCGKIKGWKPITDSEITKSEYFTNTKEQQEIIEHHERAVKKSREKDSCGPSVISLVTLEKAHIEQVFKDQFGSDWQRNAEVKEILQGELASAQGKTLEAVKIIWKDLRDRKK